jgi:hypothetical protein
MSDILSLLPLAIKNQHVVSAERYISGELAPLFAPLLTGCIDIGMPGSCCIIDVYL